MQHRIIDLTAPGSQTRPWKTKPAKHSRCSWVSIKTASGWRSIDSPYDPVGEAFQLVTKPVSSEKQALFLGAGSGFLLEQIKKRGFASAVVVTADKTLGMLNSRHLSSNSDCVGSITLIICDVVSRRLIDIVRSCINPQENPSIIFHPREHKAFPSFFNELNTCIAYSAKPLSLTPAATPKVILFPNAGEMLEPEILRACEKRGITVKSTPSFLGSSPHYNHVWRVLDSHKPDLVLSTNNKGSDVPGTMPSVCRQAGIPWKTWFFDEPNFLVSENQPVHMDNVSAYCWDLAGLESCRKLGFYRTCLLPLGTDPLCFFPGKGNPCLEGRLVYVGRPSFGNERKYFSGLEHDPHACAIAVHFLKSVQQTRSLPSSAEISEAVRLLGIPNNHFPRQTVKRLPAFILYRANMHYRVSALSSLAYLHPVVYGDGWSGLLPDSVEIRSEVEYHRDLPGIYRSDAVHLSLTHLQMRHFPNQRIFDIGACERAVIGEALPGIKQLFDNTVIRDMQFSDFTDLRVKAEYLMNNPSLRKHLGQQLREAVIQHHTISHRIETVLHDAI